MPDYVGNVHTKTFHSSRNYQCVSLVPAVVCGPFVDMTSSVIRQSPAPCSLKQYYMNRVMIKPRRSASVGNLLYRLRFTYTPAPLQGDLNAACPCAQYPNICRPAPLNDIVIRATDPDIGILYPDFLHRRISAQCKMNATLPSLSTFFNCVDDTSCILSGALPQLGPQLWLAMKHAFWDQGKSMYRELEANADPRVHRQSVHDVRIAHPWLSWGPLDKNAGVPVAHCGVLRARLFTEHFIDSPRDTVLKSYDNHTLAQSYALCHIAERAFEQGWGPMYPAIGAAVVPHTACYTSNIDPVQQQVTSRCAQSFPMLDSPYKT